MDIRKLKYFLAIAEEKQITKAAKLLHMEQPPLSRQLIQLEEELGAQLFERSRKQLTLTAAGELLKVRAEHLLLQLDETIKEVKDLESGVRGILSIGAAVSCVSILPKPIKQMREQYPLVTFKIAEGDHYFLGELLAKRSVELVISRLPFETHILQNKLDIFQLPSDPYVAILPCSDGSSPSSQQNSISIKHLASYPLLTLKSDKTTRMHEQVVSEFKRRGFEPTIICECSSVSIIMSLITAGIGASIFPKSVVSSFPIGTVDIREIEDADFQSDVGILWIKDQSLSKRAQHFIQCFTSDQSY
ncbi:LysR family transcriptional regulator [Paenibacillus sp. GSMTC-2017]|uniref:LysR family transcriptional regulator n=1 Tax=Paenibacillus sp. GSMTC-2017 TaxID=2794350 RepID=UPI0018D6346E|nr:LysR family transcriptional regulator [Paenibacillus sp. GSMTC-2017]MBH5318405.1 LysR family transcriptional regulator [Paenibacillus sp. GSMTC-2017]